MARRDLANCRAIVTGASSGIGRAIAMALATNNARLVLTARRADRLNVLAEELRAADRDVEVVAGDVADPEVRQQLVNRSREAFGGLDVLVNNAGIGAIGRFHEAAEPRLRQIIDVNFIAAAELIRMAVPLLRSGRQPIIVNIGSILGHRGIPLHAEYCASKFALRGFSEAIRPELAALGIDVLLVSPGTTETEFGKRLLERAAEVPWARRKGVTAEYVAAATLRAMRAGRHEIIPNLRGRMLCRLNRLSPRLVDWLMLRYVRPKSSAKDKTS